MPAGPTQSVPGHKPGHCSPRMSWHACGSSGANAVSMSHAPAGDPGNVATIRCPHTGCAGELTHADVQREAAPEVFMPLLLLGSPQYPPVSEDR